MLNVISQQILRTKMNFHNSSKQLSKICTPRKDRQPKKSNRIIDAHFILPLGENTLKTKQQQHPPPFSPKPMPQNSTQNIYTCGISFNLSAS